MTLSFQLGKTLEQLLVELFAVEGGSPTAVIGAGFIWKLRFDSKYEEWNDRWGDLSNRQTLSRRFIDQDSEDEGYQSDF